MIGLLYYTQASSETSGKLCGGGLDKFDRERGDYTLNLREGRDIPSTSSTVGVARTPTNIKSNLRWSHSSEYVGSLPIVNYPLSE